MNKKISIFAIFTSLVGVQTAFAQNPNNLAKCTGITDQVQRIACFDAATQKLKPTKTKVISNGKWKIERHVSAMDDSRTVIASVEASNTFWAWPNKTIRPILAMRCQEGKKNVYIVTQTSAAVEGEPDHVHIKLRFDQGEAAEWISVESTDNQALFVQDVNGFLAQISGKSTMLMGFTPFNSSPVIFNFNVKGLDPTLAEIRRVCD
jgi:hypothetical protein